MALTEPQAQNTKEQHSNCLGSCPLNSGVLALSYGAPNFSYNQKGREKVIMLLSAREWKEKSLQEQRLRPPAIRCSHSKAKGLKKISSRFTRALHSFCTRPEQLINTVGEELVKPVICHDV